MTAEPDPSSDPLTRGLRPGGRVAGVWRPVGSKSLAQRALVCASLADGETRLTGLPEADDVRAALRLVAACGAEVREPSPGTAAVVGRPPGPHRGWSPTAPLVLGESGTLGRLALAAAAFCGAVGRTIELVPRGSLTRRRSPALVRALAASGVRLEATGEVPEGFAVRLVPIGPPSCVELREPTSSQEVTALLLALSAWPDTIQLAVRGAIPSRPYVDMTLAVLAAFGVRVAVSGPADATSFEVRGPLRPPAEPLAVEPDASGAAVALAAACLSDGDLVVSGLGRDSLQGDARCVQHLAAFGCDAGYGPEGLFARGRPRHGAELDLEGEPDLAPVAAAVGGAVALAVRNGELPGSGATRLHGLGTLPGKESSRIAVLAAGLRALGLAVEEGDDRLTIAPGEEPPEPPPRVLDPHGDHRMAFAFALLGLVEEGVDVRGPGCVAKSWPGFWEDLAGLGARTG